MDRDVADWQLIAIRASLVDLKFLRFYGSSVEELQIRNHTGFQSFARVASNPKFVRCAAPK
jgi:hypothetical protein